MLLVALTATVALGRPALAADQTITTVRLGGPAEATQVGAAFAGASDGLPGWLRWALSPQIQFGGVMGATGVPDRSYRGLAWTLPLTSGLWQQSDRLSLGFSLGNGFGDAFGNDDNRDPRAVGPTPTTRLGAAIGYQVTSSIGLYVTFDHVTVSGLSREDEISNDLGMKLGLRF